jgi:hypothetical protein
MTCSRVNCTSEEAQLYEIYTWKRKICQEYKIGCLLQNRKWASHGTQNLLRPERHGISRGCVFLNECHVFIFITVLTVSVVVEVTAGAVVLMKGRTLCTCTQRKIRWICVLHWQYSSDSHSVYLAFQFLMQPQPQLFLAVILIIGMVAVESVVDSLFLWYMIA